MPPWAKLAECAPPFWKLRETKPEWFAPPVPRPALLKLCRETECERPWLPRPPLLKFSRRDLPSTLTGTAGLIDREAIVVEEVTGRSGQVKLAGEVWSARASNSVGPLEVGAPVRVVAIEGATAVVTPLPPHAALPGGANPYDGPEPLA